MKQTSEEGIFISGPSASATVYDKAHIEPIIATLCKITGDDAEDYTATDLDNPHGVFADLSKHVEETMKAAEKAMDNMFTESEKAFNKAFGHSFFNLKKKK